MECILSFFSKLFGTIIALAGINRVNRFALCVKRRKLNVRFRMFLNKPTCVHYKRGLYQLVLIIILPGQCKFVLVESPSLVKNVCSFVFLCRSRTRCPLTCLEITTPSVRLLDFKTATHLSI